MVDASMLELLRGGMGLFDGELVSSTNGAKLGLEVTVDDVALGVALGISVGVSVGGDEGPGDGTAVGVPVGLAVTVLFDLCKDGVSIMK